MDSLKIFIIQLTIFFVISSFIYHFLKKKNIIPTLYHPYSEKKDKRVAFEFYNTMFFLIFGIIMLFYQLWLPSLFLFVITVVQGLMCYFYIRNHKNEEKIMELTFNDEEIEKWSLKIKENKNDKTKTFKSPSVTSNKKPTKRIVVTNQFIYLGKRKKDKVRIIPQFQRNFYLQDIKQNDDFVILNYGIMGSPMFKRYIYFPKDRMREKKEFIKKVKDIMKKSK